MNKLDASMYNHRLLKNSAEISQSTVLKLTQDHSFKVITSFKVIKTYHKF